MIESATPSELFRLLGEVSMSSGCDLQILASICLGLVLTAVYFIVRLRKRQAFDASAAVHLVLSAALMVGGIVLLVSAALPELRTSIREFDLYVAIAGLAILIAAAQHTWHILGMRQ